MDITKNVIKENGKEKALTIIRQALELAGLDPANYDLSLRKKEQPKAAPNTDEQNETKLWRQLFSQKWTASGPPARHYENQR